VYDFFKPKLNDTQCRNAKPALKADGTLQPTRLVDGDGLVIEIKAKGAGVWRCRFELGGKPGIYTLGNYPAVNLSDARKERERLRELVKQGINPVHDRRIVRAKRIQQGALTFEAVAEEWLSAKDWQDDTKARRREMFKRVVFPTLGKLPVSAITPAIVLQVLQKAHTANGPSVAAEAKRSISGIFELAVATLRADSDPTYPIRKALPKNKTQHKRPLTTDEIGRLMRDLDGYEGNFQTFNAFRFMWLTLCSLPRQAVDILRAMRGVTGKGRFTFPHRDDRNKPMTAATLRQALKPLGWAGVYSPHATRTTGSTRLNEMSDSSNWIERQLAHAESNNVRRTNNHAEYLEGRAKK